MPVALGGDHSVHAPVMAAFEGRGPLHIVHFDAHLDFVDERHGVRYGHGNPLRRSSEQTHVTGMTQLGIRNVSSSNRLDYDAARRAGSDILSVRDVRRLRAPKGVLERIPSGVDYYLTIDIDGFDPSIAPGTGTPSHGGFLYYEVQELIEGNRQEGQRRRHGPGGGGPTLRSHRHHLHPRRPAPDERDRVHIPRKGHPGARGDGQRIAAVLLRFLGGRAPICSRGRIPAMRFDRSPSG